MKLSEAILLGSMMIKPRAGILIASDGTGCALGMGLVAAGVPSDKIWYGGFDVPDAHQWAWKGKVKSPCGCYRESNPAAIIAHIFDCHVMGEYERWTLEQLVDWVRSVEPKELNAGNDELSTATEHEVAVSQDAR